MSNITLSRPRGMKRSSILNAEREEYEKALTNAVQKAINTTEVPVKQKHVRTCILSTYREKGAGSFWANIHRQQLEAHPIVAWKFCHVFHQLMRDGHQYVISDSMKYKSKLADLGRLWGHLREGYGPLIRQYCKLLLNKLEFHQRNPPIPGSLQLTDEELDAVGEKDVNNWFELGVEMLDYIDEILALQSKVFNSLDLSRAASMTKSGQCRLAPLILCIMDSSSLYDYLVKMLFKLHGSLTPDVLIGHRDRFNTQFKQLKQFYYSSSNLIYFKYLISVPPLPESPPNFLHASAFADYVTPHVQLLDQSEMTDTPPDSQSLAGDAQLVDLSETESQQSNSAHHQNDHNGEISEKDQIISFLQHDLDDARGSLQRIQMQYSASNEQLQRRILELEEQVSSTRHLIDQMSEENERYREQAELLQNEKNQVTAGKLEETEKKAVSNEEKFNKMKDVYAKLRQEHIDVLRKYGNVQKELHTAKESLDELKVTNQQSEQEFLTLQAQQTAEHERLQQSCDQSSTDADTLRAEIAQLKLEAEQRIASLSSEHSSMQEHLQKSCDERSAEADRLKTEIEELRSQLKSQQETAEVEMHSLQDLLTSLRSEEVELRSQISFADQRLWDILGQTCDSCTNSIEDTVDQFENPAHLGVTCSPEYVLTRITNLLECCDSCITEVAICAESGKVSIGLIPSLAGLTVILSEVILQGKATANAAPVDHTERLTGACSVVAENAVSLCKSLKTVENWRQACDVHCASLKASITDLNTAFRALLGKMGDIGADELESMMEKEMRAMDQAIQQAAIKIQEMLVQRKEEDTGIKLQVNENILDSCNGLMQAVLELVRKARDLQGEIIVQGRGTGSVNDFYKRHHQWTEGLLSAAKAVGLGASVIVDAADKVVKGEGKFESLVVASQEVAASTAQLVMASQVKADRGSERLSLLKGASKAVTGATASVVGTVKVGQETLQDTASLDFSKMTLHEAKRKEMDSKVRVLELEQGLQNERQYLAELRKKHYELAGASEGWEEEDK